MICLLHLQYGGSWSTLKWIYWPNCWEVVLTQDCRSRGWKGCSNFARSVSPILTRQGGGRSCPTHYYWPSPPQILRHFSGTVTYILEYSLHTTHFLRIHFQCKIYLTNLVTYLDTSSRVLSLGIYAFKIKCCKVFFDTSMMASLQNLGQSILN